MTVESQTERLALRPDVVVSVLEDGAVLLDLSTKYFYSVNSSGWAIVQMFEHGTLIEEVKAKCVVWSGGDKDSAAVDFFIKTLLTENLVVRTGNPSVPHTARLNGGWSRPVLEKHKEPLQRIMTSAFDPSIPLAE
jgi:hypothetical protein